jgi:hypothetical protein
MVNSDGTCSIYRADRKSGKQMKWLAQTKKGHCSEWQLPFLI